MSDSFPSASKKCRDITTMWSQYSTVFGKYYHRNRGGQLKRIDCCGTFEREDKVVVVESNAAAGLQVTESGSRPLSLALTHIGATTHQLELQRPINCNRNFDKYRHQCGAHRQGDTIDTIQKFCNKYMPEIWKEYKNKVEHPLEDMDTSIKKLEALYNEADDKLVFPSDLDARAFTDDRGGVCTKMSSWDLKEATFHGRLTTSPFDLQHCGSKCAEHCRETCKQSGHAVFGLECGGQGDKDSIHCRCTHLKNLKSWVKPSGKEDQVVQMSECQRDQTGEHCPGVLVNGVRTFELPDGYSTGGAEHCAWYLVSTEDAVRVPGEV